MTSPKFMVPSSARSAAFSWVTAEAWVNPSLRRIKEPVTMISSTVSSSCWAKPVLASGRRAMQTDVHNSLRLKGKLNIIYCSILIIFLATLLGNCECFPVTDVTCINGCLKQAAVHQPRGDGALLQIRTLPQSLYSVDAFVITSYAGFAYVIVWPEPTPTELIIRSCGSHRRKPAPASQNLLIDFPAC